MASKYLMTPMMPRIAPLLRDSAVSKNIRKPLIYCVNCSFLIFCASGVKSFRDGKFTQ